MERAEAHGDAKMTQYTYDEQVVSDLHKDTYGYRPREGWWAEWNNSTPAEKQSIWDMLCESLELTIENEMLEQNAAIVAFEDRVAETLALGASDRETAIRWIVQGLDVSGDDPGYICYKLGLPYAMESIFVEALKKETV